jgi:hypothetical protein
MTQIAAVDAVERAARLRAAAGDRTGHRASASLAEAVVPPFSPIPAPTALSPMALSMCMSMRMRTMSAMAMVMRQMCAMSRLNDGGG